MTERPLKKPEWLKINLRIDDKFREVEQTIQSNGLNTICTSGNCPNKTECFRRGTATIMILGSICTRHCKFCNVEAGRPFSPDENEPRRVAETIAKLELKHCVLTSVDRDDLPDYGATHWAKTISLAKEINPDITIEALIPDFSANFELIQIVAQAGADIISHNLETVPRLTPLLRSKASYESSLKVLEYLYSLGVRTKSGIMVGVGETQEEVLAVMDDLLNVSCKIMTIGQYLQPTKKHYAVREYIHPDVFEFYKEQALAKGFEFIESGPLVRSSYFAEKHIINKEKK